MPGFVGMTLRCAATIAALASAVAGCGGTTRTVSVTTTAPPVTSTATATLSTDEVLAVPAVGRFDARCPPAAHEWTLRFIAPADGATDAITSTVRHRRPRRTAVNPGGVATFHLVPGSVPTSEPADRISHHHATTIATTPPLDIHIVQATEPQSVRVDVHLALTTLGGDSGRCALVGSRVDARTYFNGPR